MNIYNTSYIQIYLNQNTSFYCQLFNINFKQEIVKMSKRIFCNKDNEKINKYFEKEIILLNVLNVFSIMWF